MQIEKLDNTSTYHSVEVRLSYDEVRDITNGLYEASKINKQYEEICTKFSVVFDLVKHGFVQSDTLTRV